MDGGRKASRVLVSYDLKTIGSPHQRATGWGFREKPHIRSSHAGLERTIDRQV